MKERLQKALHSLDVDYCEVRFEDSRDLVIQFSGQALEQVRTQDLYGGNVRALHQGGWGFASFNDLADLEHHLKLACQQAKAAGAVLREESKMAAVPVVVDDVQPHWTLHPESVSLEEKIRILSHYQKLVLSYDHIPACTVLYQERCTTLWFANSEGSCLRQEKVDFSVGITASGRKGDVSVQQTVADGSSLGMDVLLGLEQKIAEMRLHRKTLLDAETIKAGDYTIICDPAHTSL